ncbi:MAG: Gfo/Idh/MocA family oxidoreductase [Planctomycetota bacterium]|nr:Gfo/Idh/MocA family oxidoreductase [Planctomycetota bacterium]
MQQPKNLTRRDLLKGAAALGLAAPYVLSASALGAEGRPAPSNRHTIGFIGVGSQGTDRNLRGFLSQPDAQCVAVCDVDPARRDSAKSLTERHYSREMADGSYKGCAAYNDFRDVINRADLDSIMISTPDHWHALMSLMAIRAGKDVICEKPTVTVQEGRRVADAVRRHGTVFQTSTEDRSIAVYHRMAELVRNGRVGKLQRIIVGLPSGPAQPGDPTPKPVPEGFDYDLWLGPAQWAPYCPARTHFNFRWITDYSGGMLPDWGCHLFDTAQWANDTEATGPVEVEGTGKRHAGGLYDTFYEFKLTYRYAKGVEMIVDSSSPAIRFEGTDGWVGNKGWCAPVQASSPEILRSVIGPNELHLFTCPAAEHRNFLDAVKTRTDPYFPAEFGHRVASICHIGNIAMTLGRKLKWDPAAEVFPGEPEANRYLARAMRAPWHL